MGGRGAGDGLELARADGQRDRGPSGASVMGGQQLGPQPDSAQRQGTAGGHTTAGAGAAHRVQCPGTGRDVAHHRSRCPLDAEHDGRHRVPTAPVGRAGAAHRHTGGRRPAGHGAQVGVQGRHVHSGPGPAPVDGPHSNGLEGPADHLAGRVVPVGLHRPDGHADGRARTAQRIEVTGGGRRRPGGSHRLHRTGGQEAHQDSQCEQQARLPHHGAPFIGRTGALCLCPTINAGGRPRWCQRRYGRVPRCGHGRIVWPQARRRQGQFRPSCRPAGGASGLSLETCLSAEPVVTAPAALHERAQPVAHLPAP